jgi:hypothetical protein
LIRAASTIADDDEIIVIGSQSVLGQFPDAPPELRVSDEADLYPKNHPERADLVDGSIGELSPFHRSFGYYAQGVGPETATLPAGWESRLVPIRNERTRGATGWCLEIHDLVVAKYVAGRDKDEAFVRAAIAHGMVREDRVRERLDATTLADEVRSLVSARIGRDFA